MYQALKAQTIKKASLSAVDILYQHLTASCNPQEDVDGLAETSHAGAAVDSQMHPRPGTDSAMVEGNPIVHQLTKQIPKRTALPAKPVPIDQSVQFSGSNYAYQPTAASNHRVKREAEKSKKETFPSL